MTIQETSLIMDILNASYPRFYSGLSKDEKYKTAILWAEIFKNDPAQSVAQTVKEFISTDKKGFPPAIGQIKEKLTPVKLLKGKKDTSFDERVKQIRAHYHKLGLLAPSEAKKQGVSFEEWKKSAEEAEGKK